MRRVSWFWLFCGGGILGRVRKMGWKWYVYILMPPSFCHVKQSMQSDQSRGQSHIRVAFHVLARAALKRIVSGGREGWEMPNSKYSMQTSFNSYNFSESYSCDIYLGSFQVSKTFIMFCMLCNKFVFCRHFWFTCGQFVLVCCPTSPPPCRALLNVCSLRSQIHRSRHDEPFIFKSPSVCAR